MGFVKEWDRILTHFFEDMFFEARMIYDEADALLVCPNEEAESFEKMHRGTLFYSFDKTVKEEARENVKKRRFELYESEGEALKKRQKLFFDNEEKAFRAIPFAEGFDTPFVKELFGKKEDAEETFVTEDKKRALFEDEKLLKMCEKSFSEENCQREVFLGEKGGYGKKIGGGMRLTGGRTGEIIESLYPKKDAKSPEIKIEMVNTNNIQNVSDIDETIDLISERLCEMMAKGADGIYW